MGFRERDSIFVSSVMYILSVLDFMTTREQVPIPVVSRLITHDLCVSFYSDRPRVYENSC